LIYIFLIIGIIISIGLIHIGIDKDIKVRSIEKFYKQCEEEGKEIPEEKEVYKITNKILFRSLVIGLVLFVSNIVCLVYKLVG